MREELEEYKSREKEAKLNVPLQVIDDLEEKIEERQRLDAKFEEEKQQRALQLDVARRNKHHINAKFLQHETQNNEAEFSFDNIENEFVDKDVGETRAPPIPQFDRSTKPQLSVRSNVPQSPNIYAIQRQRDYSPVPGSVVSETRIKAKFFASREICVYQK